MPYRFILFSFTLLIMANQVSASWRIRSSRLTGSAAAGTGSVVDSAALPQYVRDAQRRATQNHSRKVEFLNSDAGKQFKQQVEAAQRKARLPVAGVADALWDRYGAIILKLYDDSHSTVARHLEAFQSPAATLKAWDDGMLTEAAVQEQIEQALAARRASKQRAENFLREKIRSFKRRNRAGTGGT